MQQTVPKSWFLILIAVGMLILGIVVTTPEPQQPSVSNEEEEEGEMLGTRAQTFDSMLITGNNAIYLENQPSGAQEVKIGFVVLSKPGYVSIAADNDGVPGEIIGHTAYLEDGGEHLTAELSEPLIDKEVYYAIVHHDDGDQIFTTADTPATDSQSNVVLMTFLAQEGAQPEDRPVMP